MKKLNIILCIMLALCMFVGCANFDVPKNNDNKLTIITTIYPIYDWTKNIVKDNANVELLIDNNVDLHNYQPSAQDIVKISKCDVFIYVGGESDEWVDDVFDSIDNKDIIKINLSDEISSELLEEEIVEGMQGEEEDEASEEDEEEGPEYDEHIWLSVKNAISCSEKISDVLCDVMPDKKDKIKNNSSSYIEELKNLESEYNNVISNANTNVLIFADRFPFRYLTEDYDLNYYAAFIGCSSESEASFETISFLAEKVDEYNLKYIYKIEGSNDKIANTVSSTSNSKPEILELNSMQSGKIDESYIEVMRNNLDVLKKGLINE